ncbi:PqqD family protein [Alicyclobacillus fodiniaquatilis]|uniref:PqqD family protein n=1 Tax=Alicyclobacillus fodiniaquatilis TaxID=1661150 RepID=A0ABW4JD74_9BACL
MSQQYRWNTSVESAELDENWVVMNSEKFTISKLNPIGGFLWSKLQQSLTKAQLVTEVMAEYEVSEEVATADVVRFLDQLTEYGLIEQVG